jgi:hypothetical protein
VIVNGTLVEDKMYTFALETTHFLSSTSVPFTLTMVQVPNLALTHMKRITVCAELNKQNIFWKGSKGLLATLFNLLFLN